MIKTIAYNSGNRIFQLDICIAIYSDKNVFADIICVGNNNIHLSYNEKPTLPQLLISQPVVITNIMPRHNVGIDFNSCELIQTSKENSKVPK